jgi:hypothetical protein
MRRKCKICGKAMTHAELGNRPLWCSRCHVGLRACTEYSRFESAEWAAKRARTAERRRKA